MFSDDTKKPLALTDGLQIQDASNAVQQIKTVGNQPRLASTSPNFIAQTAARSVSTPAHVTGVQAQVVRTSDQTSTVNITFKRDPADYYFSHARVYVSGYKGNPAPVQVASGQSPVSFALENTGEPVSVIVQSNGNLGPAPISTAPNTTLRLAKSNFISNNGTGTGTGTGSGGSGYVNSVGAGAANQVAKYNSASSVVGDSAFTDDGTNLTYLGTASTVGGSAQIKLGASGCQLSTTYLAGQNNLTITPAPGPTTGGAVVVGRTDTAPCNVQVRSFKTAGIGGTIGLYAVGDGVHVGGLGLASGETNVLYLHKNNDATYKIGLQCPTSLASTYTLSLPLTAPTKNGQYLYGNTDGTMGWAEDPGILYGYRVFVTSGGAGSTLGIGTVAVGEAVLSATTSTAPTTSEPGYRNQNTGAGASTSTTVWSEDGASASSEGIPFSRFRRFLTLVKLSSTTNIRCWVGMTEAGGAGAQTTFNTDTPNVGYAMFRYSSGTDTHWQAVCGTDSAHQTVVDSGVAVSTSSPQRLQIEYNGTTVIFSIDGTQVAAITTNLPASKILRLFGSVDNKNTANAGTCSWSYMYGWQV